MDHWGPHIASWAARNDKNPSIVKGILIRKGWDPDKYLPNMKDDLNYYLDQWYELSVKKLPAPATAARRRNPSKNRQQILDAIEKAVDDEEGDLHYFVDHYWNLLLDHGVRLDHIYGCGTYGCAFATNDPNITAKLTFDNHEINLYHLMTQLQVPLPGIVDVYEIIPLDPAPHPEMDETLSYFLVKREAIEPIRDKNLIEIIRQMVYLYAAGCNPHWIEYNVESVFKELETNEKYKPVQHFIQTLKVLLTNGITLGDLRSDNFGYSKIDGRIVLFDAHV